MGAMGEKEDSVPWRSSQGLCQRKSGHTQVLWDKKERRGKKAVRDNIPAKDMNSIFYMTLPQNKGVIGYVIQMWGVFFVCLFFFFNLQKPGSRFLLQIIKYVVKLFSKHRTLQGQLRPCWEDIICLADSWPLQHFFQLDFILCLFSLKEVAGWIDVLSTAGGGGTHGGLLLIWCCIYI